MTLNSPSYIPLAAQFVNDQTPGAIVQPTWPVSTEYLSAPGLRGTLGSIFAPGTEPYMPDANENRPPRINQFSAGIQREITRNFVMEASYVGNRAVGCRAGRWDIRANSPPHNTRNMACILTLEPVRRGIPTT